MEIPFSDGSVGYVIPKIQPKKNIDVPDQPLGWQGTIEYPDLFEPMEEKEEKREKREEREEEEEEIKAESDYLEDPGDETHLVEIEEMEKENGIKLESCCEERMKTEVEKAAKELIKLEKEDEEEEQGAYGEYFVVSEKMEEGRIETPIEEAAEELSEFTQHTTSNMYPDWDYDAYEWSEMQDLKKKMSKEQKKEIRGARADKVSGVFKICEEYGQIKEK